MFSVITIAKEFGSGGSAVARRVAEHLGWKLFDRNLVDSVARTAQVGIEIAARYDEVIDSWWHRINRAGLWSTALDAGVPPIYAQFFDGETMAGITHSIILDAAAKGGCVIVGRGAQCLLQNRPEVLHVFVYAPWSQRIARVQVRLGTKNVEEMIHSADRVRAAYIQKHFKRNWKDPHLYHMMVSSEVAIENVVRSVVDVVERAELAALLRSVEVEEHSKA